ncbi:MAG: tRNA (guanosine(46)-N7)-methyltransferase TrmB [Bacteroidetes bacterium]|nr:tRNA (guanosine(46)-N7)-methyltransferase TrmB [Bacteroidota bacterium]MBS1629588.1 tRNA (guanosine(46)-N7)-methyltransferase TrmB [Bacteroidota bacterium]
MGQKKQLRFAAIKSFSNVLEYPAGIVGKWSEHFGNNNPITLELACGKGEYSTGLAAEHPERNFIGIDIKGNRIYIGAKKAIADNLGNVAFLRTQIQKLRDYFAPGEVSEIWIVFPDPFLKKESNRLTHPRFLREYQQIMKPGGRIHLKTDSEPLYRFTQEVIKEQALILHQDYTDIYENGQATGPLAIQTFYEGMHRAEGRSIHYLCFSLPEAPIQIPPKKKKNTDESVA